jgi:hypothetical protein
MARAFVRLSLEKKTLAGHLSKLLDEHDLLRALYKRHAFLRHEDERDQFLFHLQSLNVVDYFCFTNHFRCIQTSYSVLIVMPSSGSSGSSTSANPYIRLYDQYANYHFSASSSSSINNNANNTYAIPRPPSSSSGSLITIRNHHLATFNSAYEFVISCKQNLGQLTTLALGHDNAGMTPRWLVECVHVRNDMTGHVYTFPCGRWLGRGVEDDSLERLLIVGPPPSSHGGPHTNPDNMMMMMMMMDQQHDSSFHQLDSQLANMMMNSSYSGGANEAAYGSSSSPFNTRSLLTMINGGTNGQSRRRSRSPAVMTMTQQQKQQQSHSANESN